MEQDRGDNRHENVGSIYAVRIRREVADIWTVARKDFEESTKADIQSTIDAELQLLAEEIREQWFPENDHWVVVESGSILSYSRDDQGRNSLNKREGEARGELGDIRLFGDPGQGSAESGSSFIGFPMVVLNPNPYRPYRPEELSRELKDSHSYELVPFDCIQRIQAYQPVREETRDKFDEIVKKYREGGSSNTTMD